MFDEWNNPEAPKVTIRDKKSYNAAKKLQAAYIDVFKSKAGQEVYNNIMQIAGINTNCYDTNTNAMYFKSGKQEVGHHIQLMLQGKIELYQNPDEVIE